MRKQFGFTLIELLVVIAMIGILMAVILPNLNLGGAQARDAERKADLRAVQGALELYKNKYGRYPEGCNVTEEEHLNTKEAWVGDSNFWSGQAGSGYECSDAGDGNEYILGLAPEFIRRLPTDPRPGDGVGYVYVTNPVGSVYKFMAIGTVETDVIDDSHEFARCGDISGTGDNNISCRILPSNPGARSGHRNNECVSPGRDDDYAVWGGFTDGGIWEGREEKEVPGRWFFNKRIHCS